MNGLNEKKLHNTDKPRRFPGTTSFEDNELSAELFFGREDDTTKLLHLILSESLSVIFSRSGNGKTSLLQARIFKRLRERNFYPILVRLNKNTYSPQNLIKSEIASINGTNGYEVLNANKDADLLTFLKDTEIWSAEDKLKTPVLIFDQFEEIFTLEHNEPHRDRFFADLANILKAKKESELEIKIVIGIREDFLGYLERLSADIPSVFVNRFRLEALKKDSAEDAIVKPAAKIIEGVDFASPPFYFTTAAKNQLVEFLSLRLLNDTWRKTDEIEPLQLQIICSDLEERVINNKIGTIDGAVTIREEDLGGNDGLQNILGNFYDKQIQKIVDDFSLTPKEIRAVKEIVEVSLIADGRRIPMHYSAILRASDINKKAIDQLIKNNLLKVENHQDNKLVEISHDNLVGPILKSYKTRKEEELKEEERLIKEAELVSKHKKQHKRRLLIAVIISAVLIAFAVTIKLLNSFALRAEIDKFKIGSIYVKRTNPTLAFKLINYEYNMQGIHDYKDSDKNTYSYIVKRFKIDGQVKYAGFIKDKNEYCIADKNTVYKWKADGLLDTSYIYRGNIIGAGKVNNHHYFVVQMNDGGLKDTTITMAEVHDESDKLICKFLVPVGNINASVSPNGKNFVIDYYFYRAGKVAPVFKFKYWSPYGGPMIAAFSADGRYIVAGLHDSYILIQDTTGKVVRAFSHGLKTDKSIVGSVAITSDNKYVVSACNVPLIETWDIKNLTDTENLNISTNYLQKFPDEHTASVNYVSISNNNKFILTGSDDNNAILWDWNGKMVSILKGHTGKITYDGFIDDKEMVTGDANGFVILWKTGTAASLENNKELLSFSPFEYHAFGFAEEQYGFDELYDTHTFEKKIAAIYDYSNSIPEVNVYPEDRTYTNSLMNSIDELDKLHQSVFNDKRFQKISLANKKHLYDNYTNLFLKRHNLSSGSKSSKNDSTLYKVLGDYFMVHTKSLLVDTTDISEADYIYDKNGLVVDYFADSVKKYNQAIKYSKTSVDLLKGFTGKYPKDTIFKSHLASVYGNLAWFQLFTHDFKDAIISAKAGLKNKNRDFIYSNLAMAYLCNKDYNEAFDIYKKYKDQKYRDSNQYKYFKDVFLSDFDTMKKNGILTPNQPEVWKKANEIITFLKEQSGAVTVLTSR